MNFQYSGLMKTWIFEKKVFGGGLSIGKKSGASENPLKTHMLVETNESSPAGGVIEELINFAMSYCSASQLVECFREEFLQNGRSSHFPQAMQLANLIRSGKFLTKSCMIFL